MVHWVDRPCGPCPSGKVSRTVRCTATGGHDRDVKSHRFGISQSSEMVDGPGHNRVRAAPPGSLQKSMRLHLGDTIKALVTATGCDDLISESNRFTHSGDRKSPRTCTISPRPNGWFRHRACCRRRDVRPPATERTDHQGTGRIAPRRRAGETAAGPAAAAHARRAGCAGSGAPGEATRAAASRERHGTADGAGHGTAPRGARRRLDPVRPVTKLHHFRRESGPRESRGIP